MAVIKTVQEETLTALGDAIRARSNITELLEFPNGMIDAIGKIAGGEPLVLTGDCSTAVANLASYAVENLGYNITTKNVSNANNMFANYAGTKIPFEINLNNASTQQMFYKSKIEEFPVINNVRPATMHEMFAYSNVKHMPENYGADWDLSYASTGTYLTCYGVFRDCKWLRNISKPLVKKLWGKQVSSSYSMYANLFANCYTLDEINGLGVAEADKATLTANVFSSTVQSCSRLKNFTFDINDDGTPKTVNWKAQTLSLTNIGYAPSDTYCLNYGMTAEKRITNDETYQALKDDPDSWTVNKNYSRYNHNSAVATINSLPDASVYLAANGGTNTIKFTGAAGSATDGGAINTLTEEEIAVATAKGWTVSFA